MLRTLPFSLSLTCTVVGGRRFRPSVAVVDGRRFRSISGHLESISMSIMLVQQQSEPLIEEMNMLAIIRTIGRGAESVVGCNSSFRPSLPSSPSPSPSLPPPFAPSPPRGKGTGKGKRVQERPKAKVKGLKRYVCGGIGHPARLCPCEGWVTDLEQDAPEGEGTNEDERPTEEDDETLQLGYLGSESCLMSSPTGLSDAFREAGWTVVTRKLRNRQQCSRRRGCSDKRGMVLG